MLEWLEDDSALIECSRDDGGEFLLTGFSALRTMLERARKAFYAEFNAATLADCLNPDLRKLVAASMQTVSSEAPVWQHDRGCRGAFSS